MVKVNSAAMPSTLIESAMVGREGGCSVKKSPASIANARDAMDMWFGLILTSLFAAGESILSASPL